MYKSRFKAEVKRDDLDEVDLFGSKVFARWFTPERVSIACYHIDPNVVLP